MKPLSALFALGLLAATVEAQAPSYYDFMRAFDTARDAENEAGMDGALRSAPEHALFHFVSLCWNEQQRPDDEDLRANIAAMKSAWGRVFEMQTVDRVRQLVRDQTVVSAARLDEAERQLKLLPSALNRAERAGDRDMYVAVKEDAGEYAGEFRELGDGLHEADAWGIVALVLSRIPQRTLAEQEEMIVALERFVELRESWGWTQDAAYSQSVAFLGVEQSVQVVQMASRGLETMVHPDAEERVLELEFEMLEELEPDMFVQGGPVPSLWASVTQMREAPALIPNFKRTDLFLVRQAVQRFGVTTDASTPAARDAATTVRADPIPRPSLFYLDAAKTQPYAMWFFTGSTAEPYMNAKVNLVPTRERAFVFYRSAASWKTSIDDQAVVFYDDNGDGRILRGDPFENDLRLRTLGRVANVGILVPAHDSMRIGRGPRIPFSEVVEIGGNWFHLRGVDDGTRAGLRAIDADQVKAGRVQLDWQGNRRIAPGLLIIQGRGRLAHTAFDISSGKATNVPAGEYEIAFGRIVVGKGARTQMAQIFKGESEVFTVEEGKTLSLEMGAPFRIDFVRAGGDRDLAIDASKLRVLDVSGAQYAHLHNAVLKTDVVASLNPDGRRAKVYGRFTPIDDPDLVLLFAQRSPLLRLSAVGFPRPEQSQGQSGDLVLRLRLPAPGMVVGVQQDRHPLFGKLLPVFK